MSPQGRPKGEFRSAQHEGTPVSVRDIEILLVEDQPTDAELVLRALSRAVPRERIAWVRDGEQAIERLLAMAETPGGALPRLVLLDLKMPRVGGLEVATRVRAEPSLCRVPLVILSSSAVGSDIAQACRCGVNSYVVKPVDLDGLERAVLQLADYWLGLNRVEG